MDGSRPNPRETPRRLAALTGVFLAAAVACPVAQAQITGLLDDRPVQLPEQPVRQAVEPVRPILEPVQPIVDAPLPNPVEEVVQDSPVAPVREQVREIVRGATGGGGGGGSTGGGSTGGGSASTGSSSGSSPGVPQGGAPGGTTTPAGGGQTSTRRRSTRSGGGRQGGRGGAAEPTPAAGGPAPSALAGASPARGNARAGTRPETTQAKDERGPLARTVDRIVEVVPTPVWIAMGALALIALAMAGRALVYRRRARALEGERERLLRDMGLLERVLLPEVPERVGDLATSVAYRPAEGPAAGGDFYDVFELPDDRVALLVGDISGHGAEALERTGALRPTIHAHLEAGLSPRAALQAAGELIGVDANGGFTTVVAALHDPRAGTLTYAGAGHPPPILVGKPAHEPVTAVSAPPIGVGIRTGMRQTTVPLPRGAAACFFTDGLLEARSGGSLIGTGWLAQMVAGLGPLDSAEVLLDRVLDHADEAPDDMTACLVRNVAGSSAVSARVEELELEPGELATPTPERFLDACGVPAESLPALLSEAERTARASGGVVLRVTIDESGASARVAAPATEALATS